MSGGQANHNSSIESHALVHNLEVCMDSWVIVLTRGANSLGGIDISIS